MSSQDIDIEYKVIVRWKDDGNIETFKNRTEAMDRIAKPYDEYMTDGGSGFGMGWRDMDWSFNDNMIADECLNKMKEELWKSLIRQGAKAHLTLMDRLLEEAGIEIYMVDVWPPIINDSGEFEEGSESRQV